MEKIRFGQITAPVGIKGEIRVYPYLEQTRFSDLKEIAVENGSPVSIEKIRADRNMLVIKLKGTDTRNEAEALRGKFLYLPEGEKPDLGEDCYYVEDLVGCKVYREDGSYAGELKEVTHGAVQDLYNIVTEEGKTMLLPAVKAFIRSIDTEAKRITAVIPEGLEDL